MLWRKVSALQLHQQIPVWSSPPWSSRHQIFSRNLLQRSVCSITETGWVLWHRTVVIYPGITVCPPDTDLHSLPANNLLSFIFECKVLWVEELCEGVPRWPYLLCFPIFHQHFILPTKWEKSEEEVCRRRRRGKHGEFTVVEGSGGDNNWSYNAEEYQSESVRIR